MGKFLGVLVVVAALLFGAAYLGSPAWALYELKTAVETRDRDKLEALVDFPAVRENLKAQVDSEVTKAARAASGVGWTPLEAVGKAGAAWGDRKIKKLVTPESLEILLATGALKGKSRGEAAARAELRPSFAYLTPDRVRVKLSRDGEALPLTLIMERRGLVGWKVVKIELPGEGA